MDVTDPRWRELLTEVAAGFTAINDALGEVTAVRNAEQFGAARDRLEEVRDALREMADQERGTE